MSTKIYYGLRIPKSKLEHFIWHARNLVFERATAIMVICMGEVTDEVSRIVPKGVDEDESIDNEDWMDTGGERFNRLSKALELPIMCSKKGIRGINLDSWMNIWPKGSYWYIIPSWPDGSKIEIEDLPDYTEEYGYWNNTDQPEGVTDRQWLTRERNWKEVCIDDHNRTRLSHIIIEAKNSLIGLDEVERRIKESGQWPDLKTSGFGARYRADYWVDNQIEDERKGK